MENEKEIDLREIFYLLLSKLAFIIILTVVGTIAGFVYARFMITEKYTSSVSIYVNNANENAIQTDPANKAEAQDIAASKALASTYIVILNDDIVYDEVSKLMLEDYDINDLEKIFSIEYVDGEPAISAPQIRSLVAISSVNDTEVIQITATTENASLSADICAYIAEIAPELLTRVTKAGSVETIGNAKVPTSPSSPNVMKYTALGMLLGLVVSAGIVIVAWLLDNRIKTGEDFKKRFPDVPVLAEIPDLHV